MKDATIKTKTERTARGITRREFVEGALAAGVVAGAPAILRGRQL